MSNCTTQTIVLLVYRIGENFFFLGRSVLLLNVTSSLWLFFQIAWFLPGANFTQKAHIFLQKKSVTKGAQQKPAWFWSRDKPCKRTADGQADTRQLFPAACRSQAPSPPPPCPRSSCCLPPRGLTQRAILIGCYICRPRHAIGWSSAMLDMIGRCSRRRCCCCSGCLSPDESGRLTWGRVPGCGDKSLYAHFRPPCCSSAGTSGASLFFKTYKTELQFFLEDSDTVIFLSRGSLFFTFWMNVAKNGKKTCCRGRLYFIFHQKWGKL